MHVVKGRGDGVTVRVRNGDGEADLVFEHAAMTWTEVDHWARERKVPSELIFVDDDAQAILGPRPEPSG